MHISEGVLDPHIYIAGYAAAAGLAAVALKKIDKDDIPKVSVMGAAFFVASLIHFKIGVTSIHLTLVGLVGIVLGWQSVPALLVGLFFQAVMFQHGGLTTLGINTVIFSLPALTVYAGFTFLYRRLDTGDTTAAGRPNARPRKSKQTGNRALLLSLGGAVLTAGGILLAAGIVFVVIILSGQELQGIAFIFSISHGVLALIEGAITFLIIRQLFRLKPELLAAQRVREKYG